MHRDAEQVALLSVFQYVLGALALLGSLFPLIYVFLGTAFLTLDTTQTGEPVPPAFLGYMFIVMGAAGSLIIGTFAVLILRTGYLLGQNRSYTFCLVIAVIELLFFPVGTVVGILAIVILSRPGVKYLFGYGPFPETYPPPFPPPPPGTYGHPGAPGKTFPPEK